MRYVRLEETGLAALKMGKWWIKINFHGGKPGNQFQRSLEFACETRGGKTSHNVGSVG